MCEDGSLNHEETLDFDPELQANASERVIERRPKSEHRTQGLSPGEAFPLAKPFPTLAKPFTRRLRSLRSLRSMYAGPLEARFPAIVHRLARPIASSALPCHRSVSGADPPWIGDAYGVLARSGARGCWKSPTSSDGRGQSIASFVSLSSVGLG